MWEATDKLSEPRGAFERANAHAAQRRAAEKLRNELREIDGQ